MGRVGLVGLVLVVACARGPQPPRLDDLGDMDPDVASFLRDRIENVSSKPSSAAAWGELGTALEGNGFAAAAATAYSNATTLDPAIALWWYRLALLQSRLGDYSAAFASLDHALRLAPDYVPAHVRRGMWALDRGDIPSAEAAFRRASALDANDQSGSIGLARVFLAKGENRHALDTLEQLLDDHPGDRYALQLLGTAYRRLGQENDARFALVVGAGADQTFRDPWLDEVAQARRGFAARLKQATAYAMEGQFANAIPLLEQLRIERPDDMGLATHLGGVYAAAGQVAEAIALLDSVLARDAGNFDAHVNLAKTHISARTLDRAAFHAERAVAIRPGNARAHETKGMVEWLSGRDRDAIASFDRALVLDPRNQQPRVWIGWILLEQRQHGGALRHFEDALARDPMIVDAIVGIGVLQIRVGAFDQARLTLSRAERIDPSNERLRAAGALLRQATKE